MDGDSSDVSNDRIAIFIRDVRSDRIAIAAWNATSTVTYRAGG
jgi:hypothetical protein